MEVFVPARGKHGADGGGAVDCVLRTARVHGARAQEVEPKHAAGTRDRGVVCERGDDVVGDVGDEECYRWDSAGFRRSVLARREQGVDGAGGAELLWGRRQRSARAAKLSEWTHVDEFLWIRVLLVVFSGVVEGWTPRSRGGSMGRGVEARRRVGAHRARGVCGIDENSGLLASLGRRFGRRRPWNWIRLSLLVA